MPKMYFQFQGCPQKLSIGKPNTLDGDIVDLIITCFSENKERDDMVLRMTGEEFDDMLKQCIERRKDKNSVVYF